ncbi:IS1 family transposase [Escherichia coli]
MNARCPCWSVLGLLSAFEVVVWMTDGLPLYESRLKGTPARYQQAIYAGIQRHNQNLRQHLARWAGSHCRSQNRWRWH